MNPSVIIIAVLAVAMLALQAYLTNLQYKNYQDAVRSLQGKGWILGIGLRKGGMSIHGGSIVILAWDQQNDCIKACKKLQGPGIWKRFEDENRIGLRKGGMSIHGGSIVILAWDQQNDCIKACKKLQGPGIWKRFEDENRYCGMTLNEIRKCGIEEDYKLNKRARDKQPYSPLMEDKRRKKGAMIQAIEAIDQYLARQLKTSAPQKVTRQPGMIDQAEIRRRAEARKQAIRKATSEGEHKDVADDEKGRG